MTVRKLDGHKVNPANDKLEISVLDDPGHGGACHHYLIEGFELLIDAPEGQKCVAALPIPFQEGPINEAGVNGITHEALLAILIDRMQGFQSGPYACRDNALALTKLQEAQMWLQKRTRDRMARNVEGTHEV